MMIQVLFLSEKWTRLEFNILKDDFNEYKIFEKGKWFYMNRPITTLFMLESLDGKISSGSTDN